MIEEGGKVRVRLELDPDASELLIQLAGGERKRSEYLNRAIRWLAQKGNEQLAREEQLTDLKQQLEQLTERLSELENGR